MAVSHRQFNFFRNVSKLSLDTFIFCLQIFGHLFLLNIFVYLTNRIIVLKCQKSYGNYSCLTKVYQTSFCDLILLTMSIIVLILKIQNHTTNKIPFSCVNIILRGEIFPQCCVINTVHFNNK